ncbi:MAG: RidA family protein [Paraclostridium sp.]
MNKCAVVTENAPKALGPYSQGIIVGNMVYTSGELGIDPSTMKLKETIEEQTRQALENIKAILIASKTSMSEVIKVTLYITNIDDFAKINAIYSQYFTQPFPARSVVQVSKLPLNAQIEIDAVALIKCNRPNNYSPYQYSPYQYLPCQCKYQC